MNLLLDTHTFIWLAENDLQLSSYAKASIENRSNTIHISMASFWEMGIKISKGKLKMSRDFRSLFRLALDNGFHIIHINFNHILKVSQLPYHHGDPFDRIIIAQSMIENMPIVGKDNKFEAYGVNIIW